MNRKPSPKSVRLGVYGTVDNTVDWAVWGAVESAVWRAVENVPWAVDRAVEGVVYGAMNDLVRRSVLGGRPHPNLHLFVAEIQQARGDVL